MNGRPCKACGTPILFVKTENGKTQVLDETTREKRIVVIDGVAKVMDTYLSHFSTCSHAKEFRRNRGTEKD